MHIPRVGLNLHDEDDFRQAAYPLFEANEVEILEYSFDSGWGPAGTPEWQRALIDLYSSQGRLLGHGVTFSPLSGKWEERQERWLQRFSEERRQRTYLHVSEHFGFMTAGNFHDSAPLPVPRTEGALRVGRDRLKRLAEVAEVPVGLENLAFAFGAEDVRGQGAFLEDLLAPVNGFLLLDLHNIYCQVCNFKVDACTLLESYPLARVRELHVSGGTWSHPGGQPFRRDTHNGPVPDEVFALLAPALERCPNVQAVVYEWMGGTLPSEEHQTQFRNDFRKVKALVREACLGKR